MSDSVEGLEAAIGRFREASAALSGRGARLGEIEERLSGCEGVRLDELGWLPVVRMTDRIREAIRESVAEELGELEAVLDVAKADLGAK